MTATYQVFHDGDEDPTNIEGTHAVVSNEGHLFIEDDSGGNDEELVARFNRGCWYGFRKLD